MNSESAKVVDPVCGMNIEADKAFAKRDYQGKTVYFCSDSCRKRFDADPSRFVRRPG